MTRYSRCVPELILSSRVGFAGTTLLGAALFFSAVFAGQAAAQDTEYAYAVNVQTNAIDGYRINGSTGALTPLAGSPFAAGKAGATTVAIDQHRGYLYVTKQFAEDNDVAGFRIDWRTGALSPLSGSPFTAGSGPTAVAVDPLGQFVYVANLGSNNVSGFRIVPETGNLIALSGSPFAAGNSPNAIAIDPSGSYVYVANSIDNTISAYAIDRTTGGLSALTGSPFATGTGPLSIAIDPLSQYLYASDTIGEVYSYDINSSTGALSEIGVASSGGNGGLNGVTVDPTDRYVFAAGYGGVYTFSIVQLSTCFPCVTQGSLTLVGVTPPGTGSSPVFGEWTPTAFVEDYTGRFGYAPNGPYGTTGNITGFTVAAGTLTEITGSPFPAAAGTVAMAITRPPTFPVFSAELVPDTIFQPIKSITAAAINNAGAVTGTVSEAGSEPLDFTFLFANGATGGGGGFGTHMSFAYGLNDKDQVVGTSATSVPVGSFLVLNEAYLFSGGTTTNIDGRAGGESAAYAINNSGLITGWHSTGTCQVVFGNQCTSMTGLGDMHAFLYNGTTTDLGTLGGNFSEGLGINNGGVIVGGSNTVANGPNHLFRYEAGKMTDLGMMGGQPTQGVAINNLGQIIGTGAKGFVYSNGHYQALPLLPGGTYNTPAGIDDLGLIVGTCDVPGGGPTHACLSGFGLTFDLNDFVNPGLSLLTSAAGINNQGQFVAQGLDGQVYVLTPTIGMDSVSSSSH
jgi:probable HAF family extracellular repeat protein